MSFEVRGVAKRYGAHVALAGVSLRVARGELVSLLGPSGCGKTTLLRVLAGLETVDAGAVFFDGADVTHAPPAARLVGLVFQHYALFEHMSVFENVAFGLRVRGAPTDRVRLRVRELLERVRGLPPEPSILLLDEPFGALDARVRQELRAWLRRLHDDTRVTTVLVTHDREDAFEIADRVAVMNAGSIEQLGPPLEVFHRPASAWVMRFLGDVNELPGTWGATPDGVGYVRPHELEVSRSAPDGNALGARVRRVQPAGASVRVELDVASMSHPLVAELDERRFEELELHHGDAVFISPRRVRLFEATP
jgi:sulfate/thiosulfate transport system ATP-binding protein